MIPLWTARHDLPPSLGGEGSEEGKLKKEKVGKTLTVQQSNSLIASTPSCLRVRKRVSGILASPD